MMSSGGLSHWTQVVAFGIVMIATVLGNISLLASETASHSASASPPAAASQSVAGSPALLLQPGERLSGVGYSGLHSSASGIDGGALAQLPSATFDGSSTDEPVQVVPAIYAWDPDVRFVFYRHVSKWM